MADSWYLADDDIPSSMPAGHSNTDSATESLPPLILVVGSGRRSQHSSAARFVVRSADKLLPYIWNQNPVGAILMCGGPDSREDATAASILSAHGIPFVVAGDPNLASPDRITKALQFDTNPRGIQEAVDYLVNVRKPGPITRRRGISRAKL